MAQWYVYILRCGDGTLYTGITRDVPRRLAMHRSGRGAKYTRGRGPLELGYAEPQPDHPSALRRERQIKRLPRQEKLALCSAWQNMEHRPLGVPGEKEGRIMEMKKPVLVVMAAGMGSRYGGLKQIDPVGTHGEAILDYSLYDARRAGFETVVLVIKEQIKEDFMATVGKRLERCGMEIRYAYQEISKLPEGYSVPQGRTKPWGTGHAVLCAGQAVDGAPFAVVNADDYYGPAAFRQIFDRLSSTCDHGTYEYCMVGYRLENTVTDNGSVSRGVCRTDEDGYLESVTECTRIEKYPGGIHFTADGGESWTDLPGKTTVSMNLWGFTPSFQQELEARFPAFLDRALAENPMKGEYFLPSVVSQLLQEGKARVKVMTSEDKWYGVTYQDDKPQVMAAMAEMTAAGRYPDGLWSE